MQEAKVKEEPMSEEEEGLVLQDLRWCRDCKSKSYIRQGLCSNLYCKAYYLGVQDCGSRLSQRGAKEAGRIWTPQTFAAELRDQVESELLIIALEEELQQNGEY